MTEQEFAEHMDALLRSPRGANLARLIVRRASEIDPGEIQMLVAAVAAESGIEPELIFGVSRVRRVSAVRHLVWLIARDEFGLPYQRIAAAFARDHTTVINGCARTVERLAFDIDLAELRLRSLSRFRNAPPAAEIGHPECET